MSRRMMAGLSSITFSIASLPFLASPQTWKECQSRSARMVVRATELSSAMSIRAGNWRSGAQLCQLGGGWEAPCRAGYAVQARLSVQYVSDCRWIEGGDFL